MPGENCAFPRCHVSRHANIKVLGSKIPMRQDTSTPIGGISGEGGGLEI